MDGCREKKGRGGYRRKIANKRETKGSRQEKLKAVWYVRKFMSTKDGNMNTEIYMYKTMADKFMYIPMLHKINSSVDYNWFKR